MSSEFYDAQEHQLNKRRLEHVRQLLAIWWATHPGPEMEGLISALEAADFKVPVLYCEGYTKHDDPCGLRRYHEGECRWK